MPRTTDFYSIPLIYDVLHQRGTATDIRTLRLLRRTFGPPRQRPEFWLEPACGTARYGRYLSRRGTPVFGFDSHPAMLAGARRLYREDQRRTPARAPLTLFLARMEDFDTRRMLPPITLAFNLINTIRHLADDRAMLRHLAAVARVLRPGALYVIGLSLAAYGREFETEDVWKGARDGLRVTQVVQYLPPSGSRGEAARAERVISHLTVEHSGRTRHIDSTYALRSYNLAQWRAIIDASPLHLIACTDESGRSIRPREPGYFLFVLQRPPS
jgi:SAM-dependent methyltransferase